MSVRARAAPTAAPGPVAVHRPVLAQDALRAHINLMHSSMTKQSPLPKGDATGFIWGRTVQDQLVNYTRNAQQKQEDMADELSSHKEQLESLRQQLLAIKPGGSGKGSTQKPEFEQLMSAVKKAKDANETRTREIEDNMKRRLFELKGLFTNEAKAREEEMTRLLSRLEKFQKENKKEGDGANNVPEVVNKYRDDIAKLRKELEELKTAADAGNTLMGDFSKQTAETYAKKFDKLKSEIEAEAEKRSIANEKRIDEIDRAMTRELEAVYNNLFRPLRERLENIERNSTDGGNVGAEITELVDRYKKDVDRIQEVLVTLAEERSREAEERSREAQERSREAKEREEKNNATVEETRKQYDDQFGTMTKKLNDLEQQIKLFLIEAISKDGGATLELENLEKMLNELTTTFDNKISILETARKTDAEKLEQQLFWLDEIRMQDNQDMADERKQYQDQLVELQKIRTEINKNSAREGSNMRELVDKLARQLENELKESEKARKTYNEEIAQLRGKIDEIQEERDEEFAKLGERADDWEALIKDGQAEYEKRAHDQEADKRYSIDETIQTIKSQLQTYSEQLDELRQALDSIKSSVTGSDTVERKLDELYRQLNKERKKSEEAISQLTEEEKAELSKPFGAQRNWLKREEKRADTDAKEEMELLAVLQARNRSLAREIAATRTLYAAASVATTPERSFAFTLGGAGAAQLL